MLVQSSMSSRYLFYVKFVERIFWLVILTAKAFEMLNSAELEFYLLRVLFDKVLFFKGQFINSFLLFD